MRVRSIVFYRRRRLGRNFSQILNNPGISFATREILVHKRPLRVLWGFIHYTASGR